MILKVIFVLLPSSRLPQISRYNTCLACLVPPNIFYSRLAHSSNIFLYRLVPLGENILYSLIKYPLPYLETHRPMSFCLVSKIKNYTMYLKKNKITYIKHVIPLPFSALGSQFARIKDLTQS